MKGLPTTPPLTETHTETHTAHQKLDPAVLTERTEMLYATGPSSESKRVGAAYLLRSMFLLGTDRFCIGKRYCFHC